MVTDTPLTGVYEASTEAYADRACGVHRRNWLKPSLGEQHGYTLATYSESQRTTSPSTATEKVSVIRQLSASPKPSSNPFHLEHRLLELDAYMPYAFF